MIHRERSFFFDHWVRRGWTYTGVSVLSLVLFLSFCWFYWFYTVEDAYISFRYARNLIQGCGLVYNPGEHVEGYTNFLWVMFLALFGKWMSFTVAAKILGIVSGCLTLWLLSTWPGKHGSVAALMTAAVPGFALWSVAGLETPLFTVLVTLGFYLEAKRKQRREWLVGLAFGLAALTRPEGYLFFGLLLLLKIVQSRGSFGILVRYAAGFLAISIPHIMFRYFYYHAWIPNTFWVKSKTFQGEGWAYFKRYLAMTGGVGLLLSPLAFFHVSTERSRQIAGPLFPALVYLAYVFKIGGDWMPFGRFLVPALPLVFISLCSETDTSRRVLKRVLAGVCLLNMVVSLVSVRFDMLRFRLSHYNDILYWEQPIHEQWEAIGRWLKQNVDPGNTLCTGLAGIIPFYSELRNIDRSGLTDREIARVMYRAPSRDGIGITESVDEIVLAREPDIVLIDPLSFFMLSDRPVNMAEISWPLLRNPVFLSAYRLREVRVNGRRFMFYEKKGKGVHADDASIR